MDPAVQNLTPVDFTEENEIKQSDQELKKKYILTPKYQKWILYMSDKNHKSSVTGENTYMNQTQSAIEAYNLDPVKQYSLAGLIGSKNIKKYKDLAAVHYSKQGINFGRVLDLLWNKAVASSNLELLGWICRVAGIELPEALPDTKNALTQNNQFNFGEGGLNFAQFNDAQLKTFLESKRSALARRGGISTPGDGETNQPGSAQVRPTTPQTDRSDPKPQAIEGTVLGQQGGQNGVGSTGGSQVLPKQTPYKIDYSAS